MRYLLALALVLLCAPLAQAGCQVTPGAVSVATPYVSTYSNVDCTTNNGSAYELRIYFQENSGGTWHSSNLDNPAVFRISSPGSGYHQRFNVSAGCAMYDASSTATRNKSVLENLVTHTKDTENGTLVSSLPSGCQ